MSVLKLVHVSDAILQTVNTQHQDIVDSLLACILYHVHDIMPG